MSLRMIGWMRTPQEQRQHLRAQGKRCLWTNRNCVMQDPTSSHKVNYSPQTLLACQSTNVGQWHGCTDHQGNTVLADLTCEDNRKTLLDKSGLAYISFTDTFWKNYLKSQSNNRKIKTKNLGNRETGVVNWGLKTKHLNWRRARNTNV